MQLQVAAKPSVQCCQQANTNEQFGDLATPQRLRFLLWLLLLLA